MLKKLSPISRNSGLSLKNSRTKTML